MKYLIIGKTAYSNINMGNILLFISICMHILRNVECLNIYYYSDPGFQSGNGQPTKAELVSARSITECSVWCWESNVSKFVYETSGKKCYCLSFPQTGESPSNIEGTPKYYISVKACATRYNLVTGPRGISDSQFSASSFISHTPPYKARLNNTHHWSPIASEPFPFLQVDFRSIKTVEAIVTQGKYGWKGWILTYEIYYSLTCNESSYLSVKQNGVTRTFPGNTDGDTPVTNYIYPPALARCLHIKAIERGPSIGLRWEVKGC